MVPEEIADIRKKIQEIRRHDPRVVEVGIIKTIEMLMDVIENQQQQISSLRRDNSINNLNIRRVSGV